MVKVTKLTCDSDDLSDGFCYSVIRMITMINSVVHSDDCVEEAAKVNQHLNHHDEGHDLYK